MSKNKCGWTKFLVWTVGIAAVSLTILSLLVSFDTEQWQYKLISFVAPIVMIYALPLALFLCLGKSKRSLLWASVVGLAFGFLAGYAMMKLPSYGWEQLSSPPNAVSELIGVDAKGSSYYGTLYARSDDGQIWALDNRDWQPVETTANEIVERIKNQQRIQRMTWVVRPWLPATVIDSAQARFPRIEQIVQVYYILTDDGNIWFWEKIYGWEFFFYLLTAIVGGGLAIAATWLFDLIKWLS